MDLGLSGRSVVITGGSRGIGRACAETFAAAGCRLHLVAREQGVLERARAELAQTHDAAVTIQVVDLAALGAAPEIASACPDADVVVNNAGGIRRGSLEQIGAEEWRRAWQLKVFGYIDVTREYVSRMRARGSGVIVNVIGLAAEKHEYDYVAGSTGNAALATFTRTMGSESLTYGVRIVGVNPGWVATERGEPVVRAHAAALYGDAERAGDVLANWGQTRYVQPREVADVVAFLASDRASAICGEVVNVDLGLNARNYPRSP